MVISHSAINLEKPSSSSVKHVDSKTENKLAPKQDEIEVIKKLKEKLEENNKNKVKRLHKKRRPKGPNPLSCKKRKNKL